MKALVTSEWPPEAIQKLKDLLKDEVFYESWRESRNLYFNAEDLVAHINELGVEIFITEGDNVKRDAIENLDLKIIGSTRDDPNNVDVKAATEKKIPVLFTPKRNTISVAELTVGVMIALVRNVYKSERVLHSDQFHVAEFADYVGYFNMFKGMDLYDKTVGIVGLGSIGFEVAKRLLAFNVHFLIYDPYVNAAKLTAINGKQVDIDTLMKQSDVITLHCPPIDETDQLINADRIAMMKPTAYLVNLARASVTDEDALLEALKEGKIAGAALDVFGAEPLDENNEFLKLDNVLAMPHLGGDTNDTNMRHALMIIDGIDKILKKQMPSNVKNPEVLPGYTQIAPMPMPGGEIPRIPPSMQFYQAQCLQIVEVCTRMMNKGFIVGSAGNVSMRVKLPNGEDAYLVTASTKDYSTMSIDDVVLVDAEGNLLLGARNPTSERPMHVAIYKAREDVQFIIHSHASFSTAMSIARMSIGPIVDEIYPFIGGCEVAEYGMAGTDDLAQKAVKALGNNYAVFLANHGNLCCGTTMEHAWNILNIIEHAAKTQLYASLLGTIYAIPQEAEDKEKEIFDIMREGMASGH